jgi:hypothetical protein
MHYFNNVHFEDPGWPSQYELDNRGSIPDSEQFFY